MTRYAIYFAPAPETALWRFGCGVIGYDAAHGADASLAAMDGIDASTWGNLTEEPRRYGFHATLKAPFELAPGADESALLAATGALADGLAPIALTGLEVAEISRFIALVPATKSWRLQQLAADVVQQLDRLRAPLSAADRARRLRSPLTERQIAYLDRLGYPYVLDEFRFHMTLSGPIGDQEQRGRIRAQLAAHFAEMVPRGPIEIDALSVFRQEWRDGRFRVIARFPLRLLRAA